MATTYKSPGYYVGLLIGINIGISQELDKKENSTLRKIYNMIKKEVV